MALPQSHRPPPTHRVKPAQLTRPTFPIRYRRHRARHRRTRTALRLKRKHVHNRRTLKLHLDRGKFGHVVGVCALFELYSQKLAFSCVPRIHCNCTRELYNNDCRRMRYSGILHCTELLVPTALHFNKAYVSRPVLRHPCSLSFCFSW